MTKAEFISLCEKVQKLPYGRNANRSNFGLVLSEGKGSCSSKHAFLKKEADKNNVENVQLILGIYKMNEVNTPKIGEELSKNNLEYIPEAHCYLKIHNHYFDFTSTFADFARINKDILEEMEINPEQVIQFKIDFHKDYLKKWIVDQKINSTFEEIWEVRERCIENLSASVRP